MATLKNIKISVIVWEDGENSYCKTLFPPHFYPEDSCCAVAKNAKDAKSALRKTVQKICDQYEDGWDEYESKLTLHLGTSHVKTKPTITYPNKSFPSPFFVEVNVPYVWRQDVVGVVDVEFPVLDYSTSFSSSSYLRQEVDRFLRQKLNGVSDSFIYNLKDVRNIRLDQFHVSVKPPKKKQSAVRGISVLGFFDGNDNSSVDHTVIELTPSYIRRNYSAAWEMKTSIDRLNSELNDSNSSIVIIGPSSCGKSTVLANTIRNSQSRFWLSNDRRLVQGTKWLGEWQQQVKKIIEKLSSEWEILCIENLAQLVANPDEADSSLAAFFIPYLRTKQIRMIGELTPEEYQNMKHILPEFIDLFEPVYIESLSYHQGRSMLVNMNKEFMRNHGSYVIDEDVAATAAHLFHRFYGESAFPGQAAQFWHKTIPAHYRKKEQSYTVDNLYDDFLTYTGMPQWLFRSEITLSYDQIFHDLSQRIIGQPEACSAVANVILRFKSAMNNPKRPIGSFLFCGPTGVGKTQMVKTLTQYLFGNRTVYQTDEKLPNRLVRLDMSEYSVPWTAQFLLEKPDGSPSKLIEQVRQNPFSVVLFDEIEKADSGVFDIILNLLDEGRLQDRQGRVTSFKNTIIIMTSNLGSQSKDSHGFISHDNDKTAVENPESYFKTEDGQITGTLDKDNHRDLESQNKYRQAVELFFRPEFFNRIDNVVAFNKLDRDSSKAIVELELSALKNRTGIRERAIEIQPTPALIDKLIELGFDEQMGARPLQRIIESKVVASLAQWLIENPDEDHLTLTLDWESNGVSVHK